VVQAQAFIQSNLACEITTDILSLFR
jgi:hypothetical protein